MSDFHTLKISRIQRETPNSVSVYFDVPDSLKESFDFEAGQYVTLKHTIKGDDVRRAYSLCSSPAEDMLRVGIKKVENGTFSVFANDELSAGDSLEVMIPEGKFVFVPNHQPHTYAAFAAGSGITPILSIIKTCLRKEAESKFLLVYGNRSKEEAMFALELEALQSEYPDRLHLEYIFSRKKEDNALFGRIQRSVVNYLLKNKYGAYDFEKFYLCGPEPMIDEVTDTLIDRGVQKDQILFELFTTTDEAVQTKSREGDTQLTIILDDETESFTMPQHKSVLEAVLEHGLDAPYSCQGGICSSCIAKIVEGKAEMRKNQILTDEEVAEGLVLTCQAHPTSEKLVVDYDDV